MSGVQRFNSKLSSFLPSFTVFFRSVLPMVRYLSGMSGAAFSTPTTGPYPSTCLRTISGDTITLYSPTGSGDFMA